MSNLKGGSFEKQIRDSNFKLNQYGNSKRDCEKSNQTHSNSIGIQREQVLKDFSNHLRDNNITEGKLNQLMTPENVRGFLNDRLEGMKYTSQETYISNFSGLVQGLQENNVSIEISRNDFIDIKNDFRDMSPTDNTEIHRSFENSSINDIKDGLYTQNFNSGVMGEVQLETGLRYSEMKELIENKDIHIGPGGEIKDLFGKGGQEVLGKELTPDLVEKINSITEPLPALNTYNSHIGNIEENKTSHSLRYEYIKNEISTRVENNSEGKSMEEIKKEVSEEILHHREDIINTYLSKM